MMVFQSQMWAQMDVWDSANAELTDLQISLCYIAAMIRNWWFAFAPLIVMICVTIAASIPKPLGERMSKSMKSAR